MNIENALKDIKKPKTTQKASFATVEEVTEEGVKIRVDGEEQIRQTYYNSLSNVNVKDRVYIQYVSGTIVVVGKLYFGNTNTGGESSTGVTKEYVDTQDAELSRQINVLSTNKAEKKYVDEQDLKSMNYKALIDNTRLYMTTQTGIYLTPASGVTDLPEGWAQGRHTLVCFNPNNDLYGFQLITTYAGSSGIGNNRKFAIRHAITEGSKWLELANTEKTDILTKQLSEIEIQMMEKGLM